MRKPSLLLFPLLLLPPALFPSVKGRAEQGDVIRTVKVGELTRRYEYHRPATADATKALPVVIAFHGGAAIHRA